MKLLEKLNITNIKNYTQKVVQSILKGNTVVKLQEVGFNNDDINKGEFQLSEYEEFKNVESRTDSLIIEAEKPEDQDKKLLTVCVLAHNNKDTLSASIDSILQQKTNFDYNILISDDSSSDGTLQLCKQYRDEFPDKILLSLNEVSIGNEENLKKLMRLVNTKYFSFVNATDYFTDENKLQSQIDALENNPDCVACGHNTLMTANCAEDFLFVSDDIIQEKYSIENSFFVHKSSMVIKKPIDIEKIPSAIMSDFVLYLKSLEKGKLFYINKTMAVCALNQPGSQSLSKRQSLFVQVKTDYKANKFFGFKYDYKFRPNDASLNRFKNFFGKKLGWYLYYKYYKNQLRNNQTGGLFVVILFKWFITKMQTIEPECMTFQSFEKMLVRNKQKLLKKLNKLKEIYPNVLSKEDTINYVIDKKCSLVRVGDGELEIAIKENTPNVENIYYPELAKKIKTLLKTGTNKNTLVCINCIPNETDYGFKHMSFYYLTKFHYKKINDFFNLNNIYGDALSFRITKSSDINKFKELWNDKKVLFVTGEDGSFEFDNELFDNIREKAFIYGPNIGAFKQYDRILAECLQYEKDWVVYIALGVTATALAWDLAEKGYQAFDLGKLDISYRLMKEGVDTSSGIAASPKTNN